MDIISTIISTSSIRKMISIILLLCTTLLVGCGLFVTKGPYVFRQDADQIERIELVEWFGTSPPDYEVLKTFEKDEYPAVLDAIKSVPGNRMGLDPPMMFDKYVFMVTYRNQEIELISSWCNGYISIDGKVHKDIYVFDNIMFEEMLSQFIELEDE